MDDADVLIVNQNSDVPNNEQITSVTSPVLTLSAIYTINSVTDWQTATTDSQSGSTTYGTYKLGATLTFDCTDLFHLSGGSLDEHYLRSGPAQTFDGMGYTITISSGATIKWIEWM